MLSTYLSTSAMILSVAAAGYALYARSYCRDCFLYIQSENKRDKTLREMTQLQVEITELTDSVVALQDSMKKLRGRLHARTVNENRANGKTDELDPEEWKRKTNQQLLGSK